MIIATTGNRSGKIITGENSMGKIIVRTAMEDWKATKKTEKKINWKPFRDLILIRLNEVITREHFIQNWKLLQRDQGVLE
jgi:hypothetical protein